MKAIREMVQNEDEATLEALWREVAEWERDGSEGFSAILWPNLARYKTRFWDMPVHAFAAEVWRETASRLRVTF